MNINLHIERLVLDGLPLPAGHGVALQAALESELAGLLEKHGVEGLASAALPHLSVASITLAAESPPAQWGRQIARSLFAGLTPSPARPVSRNTPRDPASTAASVPQFTQSPVSPKQPLEKQSHEK